MTPAPQDVAAEAPRECPRCPRLVALREEVRAAEPDWWNGAVPSHGDPEACLLIVGLAPGLKGAHRTGVPFIGDFSGTMLHATLRHFGWADGADPPILRQAMITNAVRCLPPQNRPTGAEIRQCRPFLARRIATLRRLRAILCLGRIAHESVVRAFDARLAAHPFGHGAQHTIAGLRIFDSYHCSRYNLNTRRLTAEMFEAVFSEIGAYLSDK
ncbi:MAG: uracil-DNA glycosylase [Pseudomonadota bacterium]